MDRVCRSRAFGLEHDAPVGAVEPAVGQHLRLADVLAARDQGSCQSLRMRKELVDRRALLGAPLRNHADLIGQAIDLVAVVAHEDGTTGERLQRIGKLELELPAEIPIERTERLIEKQDLWRACKDACKRAALLLATRELRRLQGFEPRELHALYLSMRTLEALLAGRSFGSCKHILLDRHVREESVLLEEVADMALPGRHIDVLLRVEEHPPVQDDAPLVGLHEASDSPERQALATARCSEKGECLMRRGSPEVHIELEAAEIFLYIDFERHYAPFAALFWLRARPSNMFIASSTTVAIARLMRTQVRAPASSPVRQSW